MSPQAASTDSRLPKYSLLLGCVLALAVLTAYAPALSGAFIWDDDSWTTNILHILRDFRGLLLIWSRPMAMQQYYPLTGTSFWLDYHFWKLWTLPYHLENVFLHLVAVFLFWKLLRKLEVPGAWLAAAIFALHPVMVESVAWITERKNVLSLVFFLGGLLAYGRFNGYWKPLTPPSLRWGSYVLAFVFLALALLAKTTTFSFPAVVLLIHWWKRGGLRWQADVLPALPFFGTAIGMSAATAWIETNHVGAVGWEWTIPFPDRCLIAGRAFWFYLGKLFWPENLCFIYPHWKPDADSVWQWLWPVSAAGLLVAAWFLRGRLGRGAATTLFFFVGTLFPVLGFMNAYGMRYAFVWDHWVYLSSLSIFALTAAALVCLAEYLKQVRAVWALSAVLLPILGLLTWKQCFMYADSETLWRTTIKKDPAAFLAYNNLGYILLEEHQEKDAIFNFEKSLAINPNFNEPHNNLGDVLLRTGHTNEAFMHFNRAMELAPDSPASYYNLGNAWMGTGHLPEAIAQFQKAVELDPAFAKAYNNLGVAWLRLGQTNDAAGSFAKAIAAAPDPDFPDAYNNMANLLAARGQPFEAIDDYQKAIQVDPEFAPAHCGLADMLAAQDQLDEAVAEYRRTVDLAPAYVAAHYNLAVILARQNKLEDAAAHFRKVIELVPDSANAHGNLANVLVAQGKLDEAVAEYRLTLGWEPNSAQAHYKLALALQAQHKFGPAISELQRALELDPRHLPAHLSLAWLLATCPENTLRNGGRAVALAEQAMAMAGTTVSPQLLDTLAAAYAEAGRFGEAAETVKLALELPAARNNEALTKALQMRLKLYEKNVPYHEQQ
jgi:tetratricopeptide (TPR) repeat protein